MAIYDCFQYFNEDHIVDLRMHILNEYVDYFVISESTKTHQGFEKKINFNLNNFPKFKHKIKFIVADYKDSINFTNHTGGESPVEQHQRNSLEEGVKNASSNDLIVLSDSDEIPDLSKINQIKRENTIVAFAQKMFMYKLNLQNLNEGNWIGSKIIKKKYISSMQELRNLKFKKYPFWRLDKRNLQIIKGGWHFSYLLSADQILKKIKSFSHGEFNKLDLNEKEIEKKILENEDIFNRGIKLKKVFLDKTYPKYILDNKEKYSKWIL